MAFNLSGAQWEIQRWNNGDISCDIKALAGNWWMLELKPVDMCFIMLFCI